MQLDQVLVALRSLLNEPQYRWREILEGIVLEFSDGCDMLLIDQRAIEQTGKSAPAEVARTVLKAFEKLDRRRTAVLIGLRHWAAETGVALQRSQTGNWGSYKNHGSSTIDVGYSLTKLLQRHTPAVVLRQLAEQNWLDKLTSAQAKELVAREAPPTNELSYRDTSTEMEADAANVSLFTGFWQTLGDRDLDLKKLDELQRNFLRRAQDPGIAVIDKLQARLPDYPLGVDCCSPKKVILIDFTNNLDQFAFHADGPNIDRLLDEHGGVDGAVEYLAAQFHQRNDARDQVIQAIDTLLAKRGCVKDPQPWNRDGWWYGTTHQQYGFDPGPLLTRRLHRHAPVDLVLAWCEKHKIAPEVTRDEIETILKSPPVAIGHRMLPPVPIEEGPQLPPLSSWDFAELDRVAQTWIAAFRSELEKPPKQRTLLPIDPLQYWNQPQWYARAKDTWVDDDWWIDQARHAWRAHQQERQKGRREYWPDQQSAYMLLAYGDNEPREAVVNYYRELQYYHDEAIEDELAWVLEGKLPWSMYEFDNSEYPAQLGKLPPHLARKTAITLREEVRRMQEDSDDVSVEGILQIATSLDRSSAQQWLTAKEIQWLHESCLKWASATHDLTQFWNFSPLLIATQFGWTDVVDRLEQNPIVPMCLLNDDMRRGFFLADFILWISRISAGPYAARWAAYALTLDETQETEKSLAALEREMSAGKTKPLFLDTSSAIRNFRDGHTKSQRQQKLAAAVVWHRYRETIQWILLE